MAESNSGNHQRSSDSFYSATEGSLASLRWSLSEFSDLHNVSLTKPDIEKKIGEMSDWVEKQKKSADEKSKKELIQNMEKFAKATVNGVQKLSSGDTANGSLEIISSVAVFAGEAMIGGPVGAAVGAIVGTICSIIGAIFTAFKPRQPSIVTQLAEVVHKELVDFNNKLQDQKYNGLKLRVADQSAQLRTMKPGEKLDDPDLWSNYVQFMGELSQRFESPIPFKYSEKPLTKDPDVSDFVRALIKYCQAYKCYMALLTAAKGKFADLGSRYKECEDQVDRRMRCQIEDTKEKLAFLSDSKYLTFLGRLPYEGGKLTKIVVVSRNAEARHLAKKVTSGLGLPEMMDPKYVEIYASMVSSQKIPLKLDRHPDLKRYGGSPQIQFINETKFPLKIVSGTAGKRPKKHTFTEVIQPSSSYERKTSGAFSVGGYILLYLDGELRSDDEPQGADVTRVIEFACSNPYSGVVKVNIQDKTNGEFTRGQDTWDKMNDGETKTIYWMTNDTHYMANADLKLTFPSWRFVVQDFDPSPPPVCALL